MPAPKGRVIYVGTGPGDPELLTLGAVSALAEADTVVLDEESLAEFLAHPAVTLREGARVVSLGLNDKGRPLPPSSRSRTTVRHAESGGRVVRLVAGDPFLDAGIADEAAACVRAGIEFEVVPGVSQLTAIAEFAGVPLQQPGGVHVVSALDGRFPKSQVAQWVDTPVVAVSTRADAVEDLARTALAVGRTATDPVIVTSRGGQIQQRSWATTLADLETDQAVSELDGDEAVQLMLGVSEDKRTDLTWFESKPLFGWRILVPRTKDQAAPLTNRLRGYGARPEGVPTISVEPPRTPQQMDKAVRGLVEGRYEWVAFTSVNAIRAIREKFTEYGLDARAFSGLKVAAVGEVTAQALRDWGIEPDLVPTGEQSARGLVTEWPPYDEVLDPINRVLLPRADIAVESLAAGLVELGWEVDDVTAYRTVRAAPPPADVREAIKSGKFDAVVFTSSSTVRNLVGIAGKPHPATILAAIGPATAKTAAEHGMRVDVQANEPSAIELADALAAFAAERRDGFIEQGEPVIRPSETRRTRRRR